MNTQTNQNTNTIEPAVDFERTLATDALPSILRVGDTLICSGTVPMIIPQGGAHVRQAEIRLPKFAQPPTVTATLHSTDSPGNVFGIFNIKINDLGNQTQVAITATNVQTGVAIPSTYLCNFIVIGKAA
jgi:hypothetical protein